MHLIFKPRKIPLFVDVYIVLLIVFTLYIQILLKSQGGFLIAFVVNITATIALIYILLDRIDRLRELRSSRNFGKIARIIHVLILGAALYIGTAERNHILFLPARFYFHEHADDWKFIITYVEDFGCTPTDDYCEEYLDMPVQDRIGKPGAFIINQDHHATVIVHYSVQYSFVYTEDPALNGTLSTVGSFDLDCAYKLDRHWSACIVSR